MSLDGPVALAFLRGTQVAGLLVLNGTLAFPSLVLRGGIAPCLGPALRRTAFAAAGVALAAGLAWFVAEAARLGEAQTFATALAAVAAMVVYLGFARLLLLRLAALVLVLAALGFTPTAAQRGWRLAVPGPLAAVALGTQPWLGHAGATGPAPVVAELVHLFGGAAWLGGLPALLLTLRRVNGPDADRILRRFSAVGLAALLAIIGGGSALGWFLVGRPARLVGTSYGQAILAKTAFLAAALALAATNRLALTPRMTGSKAAAAQRRLQRAITIEAAIGLVIVLTAAWLAALPPAADRGAPGQPWPWLSSGLVAFVVLAAAALALWFARPSTESPAQIRRNS